MVKCSVRDPAGRAENNTKHDWSWWLCVRPLRRSLLQQLQLCTCALATTVAAGTVVLLCACCWSDSGQRQELYSSRYVWGTSGGQGSLRVAGVVAVLRIVYYSPGTRGTLFYAPPCVRAALFLCSLVRVGSTMVSLLSPRLYVCNLGRERAGSRLS